MGRIFGAGDLQSWFCFNQVVSYELIQRLIEQVFDGFFQRDVFVWSGYVFMGCDYTLKKVGSRQLAVISKR